MRIINRKEFLLLPAGTVFMKYEPQVFGELELKGDSIPNDYYTTNLTSEIKCSGSDERSDILDSGRAFQLDVDLLGRDGLYEEDQLFAVYSKWDIAGLISKLEGTI